MIRSHDKQKNLDENMAKFVLNTIHIDPILLLGTKPSTCAVMKKFGTGI